MVFLDFNEAIDSVDRSVLLNILARQGMPRKFVKIIGSLYSQTQGRVRVYRVLSPFLFNFVIDIMMRALEGLPKPGVHVITGEKLVDLEYADDIVPLFEDVLEAQSVLVKLTSIIPSFGMRFASSKCKAMFQDVVDLNTTLDLQGAVYIVAQLSILSVVCRMKVSHESRRLGSLLLIYVTCGLRKT